MVGRPLNRSKRIKQTPHHGFRWCDREGFVGPSKGSPHTTVYTLCTVYGWMTVHEHYVCWLVAGGMSVLRAMRKVYYPKKRTGKDRQLKPKQKLWLEELKTMDQLGYIDLSQSPWDVYGFEIGDRDIIFDPPRRDYSDIGFGQLSVAVPNA